MRKISNKVISNMLLYKILFELVTYLCIGSLVISWSSISSLGRSFMPMSFFSLFESIKSILLANLF